MSITTSKSHCQEKLNTVQKLSAYSPMNITYFTLEINAAMTELKILMYQIVITQIYRTFHIFFLDVTSVTPFIPKALMKKKKTAL